MQSHGDNRRRTEGDNGGSQRGTRRTESLEEHRARAARLKEAYQSAGGQPKSSDARYEVKKAAIDRTINNLDYDKVNKSYYRFLWSATNEKVGKETKKIAIRLLRDFEMLRYAKDRARNRQDYHSSPEELQAYNRLKAEYDSGLNETVRKWYRDAGLPYAQN